MRQFDQFRTESIEFFRFADIGKTAIKSHAQLQIGHVVFRDQHRRADGNLRRPVLADRLAAILQGVYKRYVDGNASNPQTAQAYGRSVPLMGKMAMEMIAAGE